MAKASAVWGVDSQEASNAFNALERVNKVLRTGKGGVTDYDETQHQEFLYRRRQRGQICKKRMCSPFYQ
jgi:hypothetical protein